MRKSKKQLMKSGIAGLLIASMAVGGGTLAYLTDSETAENTFTVGKVKIALTEPNYPGNDSEQVKDLVPNEIVKKDPQVQNTGINDAIIYLKVEVPKANVTVVEDGGARSEKKVQEIFTLKNLKTGDDGTWMEIRKDDSATDKCVYVFAYKTKLAKDATTTPLFDEVQLKNVIEQEIDTTTQNIKINAYAIQADNILDVDTTTLDQTILDKVYDIYVNQSGDKDKQADSGDKDDQKSGTAVLLDGQTLNVRMKTLAGDASPSKDSTNSSIKAIEHSQTAPSNEIMQDDAYVISEDNSGMPIYMWFDNGHLSWWSAAKKVEANSDLSYLCSGMKKLSLIDGLKDWETDHVINMESALNGNEVIDFTPLSNWNTENVTNMSKLFQGCNALRDLTPLSNWNTHKVTNMSYMFSDCPSLMDLTMLKNWDTGNVSDMSHMFSYSPSFQNLTGLENWDTSRVVNMESMFQGCYSLQDLTALESWDTGKVTNMRCMFQQDSGINNISVINNWDITNVSDFENMFAGYWSHPEFTKRAGTWNNGTFTPTA